MHATDFHFDNQYNGFRITSGKPDTIRKLEAPGGVADRLRVVAFAELQARDLFRYGAERFPEAPEEWRSNWVRFAEVEDEHAQILLTRMVELGLDPGERTVSDKLTRLCRAAGDHVLFHFLLSSAEERGMEAGVVLAEQMKKVDPVSAALFARIAAEEVEHVEASTKGLASFDRVVLQERARQLAGTL